MTKAELKVMEDTITKTIRVVVNGKIDDLRNQIIQHNAKHEADMEEIKPYLQGVKGLSLLWKVVIGAVGGIVLFGQLRQMFPNL